MNDERQDLEVQILELERRRAELKMLYASSLANVEKLRRAGSRADVERALALAESRRIELAKCDATLTAMGQALDVLKRANDDA
ncbi:MAG TPA: hypothetical protein VFE23_17080 [Usitatibacter sp.]|jgi:hypothetical protein|nr:hypothetical protein [Usitatibacter sp.]